MGAMASQITSLTIVYSTVYSSADQRKQQSSASLAFVWEIYKWSVTRKMFSFVDVIMPYNWNFIYDTFRKHELDLEWNYDKGGSWNLTIMFVQLHNCIIQESFARKIPLIR